MSGDLRIPVLSALAALVCTAAHAQPDCAYDEDELMELSPRAFNDDADGTGWRGLADKDSCIATAADLLEKYRLHQIEGARPSIMHHEAQLRAASGETEKALALLKTLLGEAGSDDMRAYRKAEIAFLEQDRDALIAARDDLLAVPPPEGFEEGVARFRAKYPDYPAPEWPLNLETVNRLIACFGEPYAVAYNGKCTTLSGDDN